MAVGPVPDLCLTTFTLERRVEQIANEALVLRLEEREERLPEERGPQPARRTLERLVHRGQSAMFVDGDDRVRGRLHEPRIAVAQSAMLVQQPRALENRRDLLSEKLHGAHSSQR